MVVHSSDLRRLRQEDLQLETSLGYIASSWLKNKQTNKYQQDSL